jgi:hypothetical protein
MARTLIDLVLKTASSRTDACACAVRKVIHDHERRLVKAGG